MRSILLTIVFSLLASFCNAQVEDKKYPFQAGSMEFNFLTDIGSMTSTGEFGNLKYEQSYTYLYLSLLPGIYITDGLSVETEFNVFLIGEQKPSLSFIPNLSYTYMIPDSRTAFYGRLGYGISNSYSLFGLLIRTTETMSVGILNAGIGIKFLITENIALRGEFNYKSTSWTEENEYFFYEETQTEEHSQSFTRLLFGFSILL